MSTVLKIRDMTLGHPGLILFRKLSLDLSAGEALAVLGANGAGKTTFVKALLGLTAPKSGTLTWPAGRPRDIGYLAQSTGFDSCFPLRVRDLVSMGAWKGLGLWDGLDTDAKTRVECALDDVGVADLADRPIHTLSGGQLQRTLFARVILQDAPLILLDEPFAAVDQST
ncbi:MAG: ATP-binding cassette domain-containing protein, partial [Pseudomonadota bacterium]